VYYTQASDLPSYHPGRRFTTRRIAIIEGSAHQIAVAIQNVRLYEATLEQERVAQELRLAHDIQVSFLPDTCPSLPGWEIAADWHAARWIGGDFYDFIPLDDETLGLVIADVSDKGMPAALFMSLSRTLVRASASETFSPAKTLQRLNQLILSETHTDMFLTLFYGVLNWRTGRLTFANAGHNPPILWREAAGGATRTPGDEQSADFHPGRLRRLTANGIVLGITEDIAFEQREITIEPGDVLILYTDGVTEPINEEAEEFGEERLLQLIGSHCSKCSHEILEHIHTTVLEFVGDQPQFDDYTLVCVKRKA
jgi:sigma-B regulation protein RsbU (phosphoserine phosphatase)